MRRAAVTLCRADRRALAAAHAMRTPGPQLVILRPPRLAAVLDRQDAMAAGERVPSLAIATARAWVRARRLVRAAGPDARIVRPSAGGLGAAAGTPVAEPRPLTAGELRLLAAIDRGLDGTPTPADVRRSVVRGGVLHALYATPGEPRTDEMLDAATAQAAVAGAVSVLLGHGLAFEDPDGTPLLCDPRERDRTGPSLDSLSTGALIRRLLPVGRNT
ncbi:hypothetical protein [Demequina silvatica]|uniref:hypothetical protein n=1 Tax=Demequina silvatica TaxID=1638988 RepID=UPI0007865033|nr:hypothetical protein [Demequina silvatica]